jgi:hypothetical protein
MDKVGVGAERIEAIGIIIVVALSSTFLYSFRFPNFLRLPQLLKSQPVTLQTLLV